MQNAYTGQTAPLSPLDFAAPDLAVQQRQLARQQQLAELLRAQALQPQGGTEMVGGWAIPNSPVKPLEKLAQALMARHVQGQADEQETALAQSRGQALAQALGGQFGDGVDGATLQRAALVDSFAPGTGKLLIQSKLDAVKPTDWERQAKAMFPGDPAKQAEYLQARGFKEATTTFSPGQTVVGVGGAKEVVPMSAADRERLNNDAKRLEYEAQRLKQGERGLDIQSRTAGAGGGFAGTGMDAQASNVYAMLTLKQQSGQQLTPQESMQLGLATRFLMEPKVVGTTEGGFSSVQPPPLPGMQAAAPSAPPTTQVAPPAPASVPAGPGITPITAPNKPASREERMDGGYVLRMERAEEELQKNAGGRKTVGNLVTEKLPFVGDTATRFSQSPAQQQYTQAQEDWVRAKLRKESGAAIGKDEMEREITTYFPMPGDGPEVVAQKQRARETAIEAMRKTAGAGASPAGGGSKTVKWSDLP